MVIRFGSEPDPAKRIRKRHGAMIRQARKLKGITPAELAEMLGVTVSAVSQWELGRYTPRQAMQVAIAKALDVPHSMLFNLDGEVAA